MANFFQPLQYLLLSVCLFKSGNCAGVNARNDDQFQDYLTGAINKYTDWLKENQLDPSPPTNDTLSGSHNGVQLDCQLVNHYVSGYSKTSGASFTYSKSNFVGHTLEMGQTVRSMFEFHGDFTCTGILKSFAYPELDSDLAFSGNGKFLITTTNAFEYITLENVGITQDYKLDLSQSWATYGLDTNQKSFNVRGDWNETLITSTYSAVVESEFAYRHDTEPLRFSNIGYPTGAVLDRFVRQVAERADLKEIINAEDLPVPFVPTPTPRTTTTSSLSG